MPVFFNGRLWVSPATVSTVDDSAMYNPNPSVGNVLAIIGPSTGGQPQVPLRFGMASEAAAALVSGDLLDAVVRAFNPSNEVQGPSEVVAIRVNPAIQSTGVIKDATGAPVINLTSTDYGLRTNQIRYKVETGSISGYRVTVALGNNYYSADNIARNALQVSYTGAAATPTITVGATSVTLSAGGVNTVIDLTVQPTIQNLVDSINSVPGFFASVLGNNSDVLALQGLDGFTAAALSATPLIITGHLQAVIDWINSPAEPILNASRVNGALTQPAVTPYTFMSGGSDGVTAVSDWQAAFDALQTVDVQWITPASSDPAVIAMAESHVSYMSTVARMERRAICGMGLNTSDSAALALAYQINSDRVSLVHLGMYDYDANGNWTLYAPWVMAAMIAGGFAGSNPGTAMTNKAIAIKGLERLLRNPTDTDPLVLGGVLCVESTATGFKVVKSNTTWLVNTNFDKVEVSVGTALDYTARSVRSALDPLRGKKGTPQLLSLAASITDTTLSLLSVPEPMGIGVLTGDAKNPPFKNITASLSGDVVAVQFQCSPVIPANYITITIFAVPYSGTATV